MINTFGARKCPYTKLRDGVMLSLIHSVVIMALDSTVVNTQVGSVEHQPCLHQTDITDQQPRKK